MTHVCGVPGRETFVKNGKVCCSADVSQEFEATILVAGQETKVVIARKL